MHNALFKSSVTPGGLSQNKYIATLQSAQRYKVPKKPLDGRNQLTGIQQRVSNQKYYHEALLSSADPGAAEANLTTPLQSNQRTIA